MDGTMTTATGPLQGMRVIELAHIMAGPVCGLMLADMGADVVKVEKVPGGDDARRFVPPLIEVKTDQPDLRSDCIAIE